MRRSLELSITAIMGAFATILSLMKIEIPFPILIYLKIDFAEIPVFLTYFLCNTRFSIVSSLLHFLGLFLRTGDILGPSMKMIAEVSNLIGLFIGSLIKKKDIKYEALTGILFRTVAMTAINIPILTVLFPAYLDFSKSLLEQVGFKLVSSFHILFYTLLLIAIYNVLNSLLSIIISYIIYKSTKKRLTTFFTDKL